MRALFILDNRGIQLTGCDFIFGGIFVAGDCCEVDEEFSYFEIKQKTPTSSAA